MSGAVTQSTLHSPVNGESSLHELFALSDEQILEIEPESASDQATRPNSPVVAQHAAPLQQRNASGANHDATQPGNASPDANHEPPVTTHQSPAASHQTPSAANHESRNTSHDSPEPPPWLAAQMKDPWSGEEAREFWNGVQQARTEAAAYRQAIASPADARALKELYPGGVAEARNAAQRARLLDEVDRAYFGAGNSPEQASAARAQLAEQLLREDPAAFREMLEAGVRALEEAGQGSANANSASDLPRLAKLFTDPVKDLNVAAPLPAQTGFRAPSSPANTGQSTSAISSAVAAQDSGPVQENGARTVAEQSLHESPVTSHESLSAYRAFERAANDDLERSVGSAIERTLQQALPSTARINRSGQARLGGQARLDEQAGAQHAVPLQDKLSAAIRQDVERALQGDRQLGEQVAQILASRRFNDDTRAQVVRLISERAQQLVPGATKRVLNDWTQTTLAAHRASTQRTDASASHTEVAPASAEPRRASLPARVTQSRSDSRRLEAPRQSSGLPGAINSRRVDYRKFSDEQILDMS